MTKYLDTAPPTLIDWHQRHLINKGRDILERLLTDPHMSTAWVKLAKKINTDDEWQRLFQEIIYIKHQAIHILPTRGRKSKLKEIKEFTRAEKHEYFLKISEQARRLANTLQGGPLDLLAYEFFPADVMSILGVPNWSQLDTSEGRVNAGHSILPIWPSLPELLMGLEAQAKTLAEEANTEMRYVERIKGKAEKRYFVLGLADYFRQQFGKPMASEVTDIATIGLKYDIDLDFVEKAIKRKGDIRPTK
jgi:hypothetical protein